MNLIKEFCRKYDFPANSTEYLLNEYNILLKNKECYKAFCECIELYKKDIDFDSGLVFERIENIAINIGIKPYTLDLLYLISLTPHLRELYEANGIDEDIYNQSVLDLKWKNQECFDVYGYYGIFVGWWTIGFFKLKRFGIGKLQYNKRRFDRDINNKGIVLKKGDLYIDVHIPSNGPLDYEKCRESYKKAYGFFKKDFGDNPVVFCCHSWILSSNNKKMLPEKSNIHKFMSDYTIVSDEKDEKNSNLWRIFGTFEMPENPNELLQDTSLRKAVAAWLKKGNTIDVGFGVMIMP